MLHYSENQPTVESWVHVPATTKESLNVMALWANLIDQLKISYDRDKGELLYLCCTMKLLNYPTPT